MSLCLTLQHAAGVVNTGQNKKNEETIKTVNETKEGDKSNTEGGDLVAESSEKANRREAAILDSYSAPGLTSSLSHVSLPVPVYGVPNSPSNNVIYPAPPPDIPPPAPLYGTPSFGKIYGVPQVPLVSKGYGPPPLPVKYGAPTLNFGQYPINLSPPKPIYGPPKTTYGIPGKPYKYHKFPPKNFGFRAPKPVYGAPITFKDNFRFNKLNNHLNTNFYTSTNSLSNLYSGVSTLNHQYGAPVLPPPKIQYGAPVQTINLGGVSNQYGVPEKPVSAPVISYGPPQPSPNPKPPHPGAPAPPTPPDIKYDGWQPIPGLVSKKPIAEIHQVSGEGSGYHDLAPPPINIGHNHISESYGAPSITLDISHGTSVLDSASHQKGVSDSYSAPLGTITGSGGVVTSSGSEAHGGGSTHSINLDLSSVGIGYGSDIQAVKSIEYDLTPHQGSNSLTDSYAAPQVSISHNEQKGISGSTIGLVPPSGLYGAPPSSKYGTPLFTNTASSYKNVNKNSGLYSGSFKTNTYLPPAPPVAPSAGYGPPSGAISFQNFAHGSSTAGIDLQHSSLNIEGANALPLTSYNVPLGSIDGSYSIPASTSSNGDLTVSLDFSHPPVSIDLTGGEPKQHSSQPHDCYKQQLQVPSLAYGVPSIDSYTSSLSSLTTNIANSHVQTINQGTYGAPAAQISLPSPQYGVPDLVHSSSIKNEAKVNSLEESDEEQHGKSYGKSVAASFGPNSELVESQSIDLNNIPLQGSLGSYTLQIQSADGGSGQVPHNQLLNEGLLQSILQAIEQPGSQGQDSKYPIILQPSVELNDTVSNSDESKQEASEIREVIVEAPSTNNNDAEDKNGESEETLQLLDTSNIALYYKKNDDTSKEDNEEKAEENSVDDGRN